MRSDTSEQFELWSVVSQMANNEVKNYIVPGLTSFLIGGEGHGRVRLFHSSRNHPEAIVPHSHRFNFACLILTGTVRHIVWERNDEGDMYMVLPIARCGPNFGQYDAEDPDACPIGMFKPRGTVYEEGAIYSLQHDQIHSIYFGRDTSVLFFEGPEVSEVTYILQPVVYGKVVPTFKVEPWMFESGG